MYNLLNALKRFSIHINLCSSYIFDRPYLPDVSYSRGRKQDAETVHSPHAKPIGFIDLRGNMASGNLSFNPPSWRRTSEGNGRRLRSNPYHVSGFRPPLKSEFPPPTPFPFSHLTQVTEKYRVINT